METFLKEMYKTYCFDSIEDKRANDITSCIKPLSFIEGLKTISPIHIFTTSSSALYPTLRYYCGKIKYPPFVLKYIVKSELNFPIEQLYSNDLNVILPISDFDCDFIDFFEVDKKIKKYIFIDVLFTSKFPGYKTWYDVIQHIAIWDGFSTPILIEKPDTLKYHICRLVDTTAKPLTTRVILSTLSSYNTIIEKVVNLFKISHYSERNASNCDRYFDIKDPYREVPFIHPLIHNDKAFLNLRVEMFTTISLQKQYELYLSILQTSFDLLRREEKSFIDDFNNKKTFVVLKQIPLIKRKKDKSQTWEIKPEHNYIVRLLCEKNKIVYGKGSLKIEENFLFDDKISTIDDILQNLLFVFEKIKNVLMTEKINFVE